MGLELLLAHPHIAALACSRCQAVVHDMETGQPLLRGGQEVERRPNQPPPCDTCPKGSPLLARERELNWRNLGTLRLYLANRALQGQGLTERERLDPLLHRHFRLIDSMLRQWEQTQANRSLALVMRLFKKG